MLCVAYQTPTLWHCQQVRAGLPKELMVDYDPCHLYIEQETSAFDYERLHRKRLDSAT